MKAWAIVDTSSKHWKIIPWTIRSTKAESLRIYSISKPTNGYMAVKVNIEIEG